VDFWIPQFYGAEIPQRVNQIIPISSPHEVERFVNNARDLNKPFYAGLAAYSYALLYSPHGSLISLRGDMDPAAIASDSNLELTDLRRFGAAIAESRHAYRARADGVTDGLSMHAGDVLVLDVPSAESLRISAQLVRKLAGEKLLGICVFRLPSSTDPATLNIEQVAVALADQPSSLNFSINVKSDRRRPGAALLQVENRGTADALGVLRIDIALGSATIDSVSVPRWASFETMCGLADANNQAVFQPCSSNRANLVRISSRGLRSGQTLRALMSFKSSVRNSLPVSIETQTDDGKPFRQQLEISFEGGVKR